MIGQQEDICHAVNGALLLETLKSCINMYHFF